MILLFEDFIKNKKNEKFEIKFSESNYPYSKLNFKIFTTSESGDKYFDGELWLFKQFIVHKGNIYFPIGLGLIKTKYSRTGLYTSLITYALKYCAKKYKVNGICSLSNTNIVDTYYSAEDYLRTPEADKFWDYMYTKNKNKIDKVYNDTHKKYDYYLKK